MESKSMRRLNPQELKLGMRFSSPVFFEDGVNMFLSERKPIKKYHLDALSRWSIPFVQTYGRVFTDEECRFIEKREQEAAKKAAEGKKTAAEILNAEEIEELEECTPVDDVEEIEELEEI